MRGELGALAHLCERKSGNCHGNHLLDTFGADAIPGDIERGELGLLVALDGLADRADALVLERVTTERQARERHVLRRKGADDVRLHWAEPPVVQLELGPLDSAWVFGYKSAGSRSKIVLGLHWNETEELQRLALEDSAGELLGSRARNVVVADIERRQGAALRRKVANHVRLESHQVLAAQVEHSHIVGAQGLHRDRIEDLHRRAREHNGRKSRRRVAFDVIVAHVEHRER